MAQEESPQTPSSDDFFNQPVSSNQSAGQPTSQPVPPNESIPRPKRIACILCRKRKLKCDGSKPSCSTCSRLGHNCEYNEERKKSGPKRGYVKLLEARLKQVENLLETRDTPSNNAVPATDPDRITIPGDQIPADPSMHMNLDPSFTDPTLIPGDSAFAFGGADDFSWEMIGLGLEEALPSPEVVDELNQIYFEKIHPSLPMIHKARFYAAMELAPHMRPAVCLRYAMWAHSASVTAKYYSFAEHFYARARKYAEQDEMRGHGESIITLAHCQAWTLLACYEFKLIYFPRAWMSIGRAASLALMMGLHRQDRVGLDVKQTLPPPRDWIDREERRRTFWMAFCQDRYASIGTGWPMRIDEQDILTNLPASDEAFHSGKSEQTGQLADILNGLGTDTISSFSGVILMATLYGRNLTHLHRPNDNDNDHDLNGEFWKRHRQLDNILLNISLSMPSTLRLPGALNDANAIFCNMNIHTAAICLHQAAIFKADKHQLPAQISAESKRRCIVAADQVTNIMKMISHLDLSLMNPFLAFCLYVAARVFVQYLKSRKEDQTVMSALQFLLSAMHVLKVKNPLTESFLVQLDVDLEGSGLNIPTSASRYKFGQQRPPGEIPVGTDAVHCVPLYEIRESQTVGQTDRQYGGAATNNSNKNTAESGGDYHHPWPTNNSSASEYPNLYGNLNTNNPSPGTNSAQRPRGPHGQQEKMAHFGPIPDFNGADDLVFGTGQHAHNMPTQVPRGGGVNSSSGPSPNFSSNGTNTLSASGGDSSHSGQPTPSTTSLPYHGGDFTPPDGVGGLFGGGSGSSNSKMGQNAHGGSGGVSAAAGSGGDMGQSYFDANTDPLAGIRVFGMDPGQSWNMNLGARDQNGNSNINNAGGTAPSGDQQQQQQTQTPMTDFGFGRTGMTPGATGMTPLPESLWAHAEGGDWMYGGWGAGGGGGNGT
ncbi:uncharacterized protein HMPREF1541_10248 [Cyphellophora europaea CBS 101466]|uniref:Zn(2)-C6 fungal-type domain-containing protein n=1 Tax=Cyphellophora europaea (strain CBS 101466) TaxID=1220924 RepID=W2S973_CYPE1|nr:uncharacterized protein HMPREF1541_10248 [Cyphellophora europaea CBS 101466]ETN44578.1 hypothetical protein HMPREF1541_10248 [Cyphellophora europaea CBS 101466]